MSKEDMDNEFFAEPEKTDIGPQLNFETTRNILFNALQGETTKTTVTFTLIS
jgi:hypothetical protein